MKVRLLILTLLTLWCKSQVDAQQVLLLDSLYAPQQYFSELDKKANTFLARTEDASQSFIEKIIRQEKKMQQKVSKVDSLLSKRLFSYAIDSLARFKSIFARTASKLTKELGDNYFPYFDTLKNSLAFFKQLKSLTDKGKKMQKEVGGSLEKMELAQSNLNKIESLQKFLNLRQQVLQEQLAKLPRLGNNLKNMSKEIYYYSERISQYKTILKDQTKVEKAVLNLIRNVPAFQKFLQSNSQLSVLFASPGSFAPSMPGSSMPVVNGLPNRETLQKFIQQALPVGMNSNPIQAIQQKVSDFSSEVDKLKNRLNKSGIVEHKSKVGFQPNSQRTKPFANRLEYSIDFQTGKRVNFIPATASVGLKVGYKLNDKGVLGIGVAYLIGLGSGWKHVNLSNEGLTIRSFLKWRLNKVFDIQGGTEWSYMTRFHKIEDLQNVKSWRQSALVGVSRNYALGKKMKGQIQILYDIFYDRHLPNTQPLVFRFGYGR